MMFFIQQDVKHIGGSGTPSVIISFAGYENYLSAHKKQFLDTLALCPKWDFVGFYVDEGSTAPNMETAPEWSRLLQDCYDGKVDLVITQKASNISKKLSELAFCTRLLAALPQVHESQNHL